MHHSLTNLTAALQRKRQDIPTDIRTAATVDPTTTMMTTATATERSGDEVETHRIDDPYGSNTILTVTGTMSTAALVQLTMTMNDVPNWWKVFLDLSDAVIPDAETMERLGAWIDVLEMRGYHLSLAGISPEHPALQS